MLFPVFGIIAVLLAKLHIEVALFAERETLIKSENHGVRLETFPALYLSHGPQILSCQREAVGNIRVRQQLDAANMGVRTTCDCELAESALVS